MLVPILVLGTAGVVGYIYRDEISHALGFGTVKGSPPSGAAPGTPGATPSSPTYHTYKPDLNPVGSGSAGTYFPRSVAEDVEALNFLGHTTLHAADVGGGVSQAADMASHTGAWHPGFQQAVRNFQVADGATGAAVDGWIGPITRSHIAQAVANKNASQAPVQFSGQYRYTAMRRAYARRHLGS